LIKKHKNRNTYYYAGNGLWVRDFTKKSQPIDINNLITEKDMIIMMNNESTNHTKMLQNIDTEDFSHQDIVIVNNGYGFNNKKLQLDDKITIIGVHDILKLWNIQRRLNYYVVNDPYECLNYLPNHQKWSKCIASIRTNADFIEKYKGLIYTYTPTPDANYSGLKLDNDYFIDDYRNAICAAIGLSYKFNVKKLLLLYCDEAYDKYRPGTEQVNGLWIYPQQKIAHNLIDASLYWLRAAGIKTGYHGKGPEYKNAAYIEDISNFFNEESVRGNGL
jgi:hypothetical protein